MNFPELVSSYRRPRLSQELCELSFGPYVGVDADGLPVIPWVRGINNSTLVLLRGSLAREAMKVFQTTMSWSGNDDFTLIGLRNNSFSPRNMRGYQSIIGNDGVSIIKQQLHEWGKDFPMIYGWGSTILIDDWPGLIGSLYYPSDINSQTIYPTFVLAMRRAAKEGRRILACDPENVMTNKREKSTLFGTVFETVDQYKGSMSYPVGLFAEGKRLMIVPTTD